MSLLLRPTPPPLGLGILTSGAFITAETLVAYPLRSVAPEASLGVLYLLGVLVVSIVWGLALGAATSLVSVVTFDFFHVPPTESFVPAADKDWVALAILLAVALLLSSIADLARTRAIEADERREEADLAAEMGRVLLSADDLRSALRSELEASRDELRLLAQEQTALRRVATLVARAVPASEIFEAVAAEVAGLLAADSASLVRFDGDDRATIVAHRSEIGLELPFAGRVPDDSRSLLRTALSTRRAARVEGYGHLSGPAATLARKLGIRCAVGAPILVEDRVWGAIIATWVRPELPPADTEARMAEFTELVATAIANAESRAELAASRARVVATADATRRRIERDLHDGTQQRLVSLGLQLRAAQDSVPAELVELRAELDRTARGLTGVVDELLEIPRGIHPATLAKGGLGPALKTLARRSAVPVELDVRTERRLPGPVEVAAYYVVCEALTNAAKHARASVVQVDVEAVDSIVQLTIRDDGVGGADPGHGSGLIGLRDRLEALGGNIEVTSPAGGGTLLRARIPINGA